MIQPFSDYLLSPAMDGSPHTSGHNQAIVHTNCISHLNMLVGYAARNLRLHSTLVGVMDECGIKENLKIGNAFYGTDSHEVMTRTTIERDGVYLDFHAFLYLNPGKPGLGFLVLDLGQKTKGGVIWAEQHISGWCNVLDDDEAFIDIDDCSVEELPDVFQRVKDALNMLEE